MNCIITGVLIHPVNLRLNPPETTEHSAIGIKMLSLRDIILLEYKDYINNKTNNKPKKVISRIILNDGTCCTSMTSL